MEAADPTKKLKSHTIEIKKIELYYNHSQHIEDVGNLLLPFTVIYSCCRYTFFSLAKVRKLVSTRRIIPIAIVSNESTSLVSSSIFRFSFIPVYIMASYGPVREAPLVHHSVETQSSETDCRFSNIQQAEIC